MLKLHLLPGNLQAFATSGVKMLIDFLPLPGSGAQPYIIVGGPRSGSTLLQTLLHSHPNIICMRELLREESNKPVFYRYFLGRRRSLLRKRNENVSAFLQEIFSSQHPSWIKAVGFKALYSQPYDRKISRDSAWQALSNIPDLKVVWLQRNELDSVLSFIVAKQNDAWLNKPSKLKARVDPAYFLKRLRLEKRWANEARAALSGAPTVEIDYEELIKKREQTLARVALFLGVPPIAMRSPLRKQAAAKRFQERVENHAELLTALEGTEWHSKLLALTARVHS
jgi:LPS sulfotransferase NodH